ncbi:hypothetical protein KFK09_001787 [Dendrobium nobile]|uniref:DUF4283 domain-containing protein n=1 Tax=Dendrobium nobile TaxID=94219 RepID=A0A8T3C5Y4_DENNO|nr:hypothetical protein KFK09_001787 [Dendrobium nobile]
MQQLRDNKSLRIDKTKHEEIREHRILIRYETNYNQGLLLSLRFDQFPCTIQHHGIFVDAFEAEEWKIIIAFTVIGGVRLLVVDGGWQWLSTVMNCGWGWPVDVDSGHCLSAVASGTRSDIRTGCPTMIRFTVDEAGYWKVKIFIETHNHDLARPEDRHLLRSCRNVCDVKASILKSMTEGGIRTIDACTYLDDEVGEREFVLVGFGFAVFFLFESRGRMSSSDRRQRIAGGCIQSGVGRNSTLKPHDQRSVNFRGVLRDQEKPRLSPNLVIIDGIRQSERINPIVEGKGKGISVDVDQNVEEEAFPGFQAEREFELLSPENDQKPMESIEKNGVNQNEGFKSNGDVNQGNNFESAWKKTQHIKLNFDSKSTQLSEDGVAVKLKTDKELSNSHILKKSLVIKILGQELPFSISSQELRRQWSKYGSFHLTTLGNNWILCSFANQESMEEVLNGGPWYIGNHIIGMDRWSPSFSTDSLKGITSPVWIRFLGLPLSCWDEDNIPIIASMIGTPLMLDGNSFKWGKREYARCCVCVDLEKSSLQVGEVKSDIVKKKVEEYGSWIHVKFNNRRFKNAKKNIGVNTFVKKVYKPVAIMKQGNAAEVKEVCITEKSSVQAESAKETQDVAVQVQKIPVAVNKFQVLDCDVEEGEITERMNVKIFSKSIDLDSVEAVGSPGLQDSIAEQIREEQTVGLSNSVKGHTETKISSLNRNEVNQIIGSDWDYYLHPSIGNSGGILMLWKKDFASFEMVDHSAQVIIGKLITNALGKWSIATVYGGKDAQTRRFLWRTLENSLSEDDPCIIGGDFNCILSKEDKRGGKQFCLSKGSKT